MPRFPNFARWIRGLGLEQQASSQLGRKRRISHVGRFERMEPRVMLHAGGVEDLHPNSDHGQDGQSLEYYDASVGAWLHAVDVSDVQFGTNSTGGTAAAAGATNPLSDLPRLSSLAGAADTLYLDFNGHSESTWGSYRNINTPVYDTDGDRKTFSDAELTAIHEIWQRVSEDYAPFKVNVTTIDPGNFGDGKALRVSIGGNGSWVGSGYGGIGYVDAFTNSAAPNTVFVFSENLGKGPGSAKLVGDAASHESGHGFGLQHQSKYNGSTKLAEYNPGTSATAPLMGKSYSATRSLWWHGPSTSSKTIQDDMAVLARSANGFGYRADDHGSSYKTDSELAVDGSSLSGSGIIEKNGDRDSLRFETSGGRVTLSVNVATAGANLDAILTIYNDQWVKLKGTNPSSSLSASITMDLTAGEYFVRVYGTSDYGSVGQYTISGTAPQGPLGAPLLASGSTADTGGIFSGLATWNSWGLAAAAGSQSTTAWAMPQVNVNAVASATSFSGDTLAAAFQPLPGAPFSQAGRDALTHWRHDGPMAENGRESAVWVEYERQSVGRPRTSTSAVPAVPGEFSQDGKAGSAGDLTAAKDALFSQLSARALAELLSVG